MKQAFDKMPGHWLLAAMGKKVLRPGGIELTRWMIQSLGITNKDDVVELAPGVGKTAGLLAACHPATYTAIERDSEAAAQVERAIRNIPVSVQNRNAEATGLPDSCASVVCGEAFLTMQSEHLKERILKEASRILKTGGKYGLHELSLKTDDPELQTRIQADLSKAIRVNARPLTQEEWVQCVQKAGFRVLSIETAPMALLELPRLLQDEGWWGTAKMTMNLLRHPRALRRVLQMRAAFRRYAAYLGAVSLIAEKPGT